MDSIEEDLCSGPPKFVDVATIYTSDISETCIEERFEKLICYMNELVNYDIRVEWFYLMMTTNKVGPFLLDHLETMWNFRGGLSNEMKKNIIPPHGCLFYHLGYSRSFNEYYNFATYSKLFLLEHLEKLVYSGNKKLYRKWGLWVVVNALISYFEFKDKTIYNKLMNATDDYREK